MTETFSAIAIVLGLTELIKQLGVPSRFCQLASLAIGIVIAFLVDGITTTSILSGIVYGLSASGLYSGGKTTIKELISPPAT